MRPWGWARKILLILVVGILSLSLTVAFALIWQFYFLTENNDPKFAGPTIISSASGAETKTNNNAPLPGILADINDAAFAEAEHKLDPLLKVARAAQAKLLTEVADYSAIMSNEVRLDNGKLREPQIMQIKVRHPREEGTDSIPFSLYTCFLKPASMAGQEAIWVAGRNDGNLIAHPAGLLNWKRFTLEPTGSLAMNGNRYPIFEIGMERLLEQIIAKGERDRQAGDCEIEIDSNVEVNGRQCLKLTITHPERREPYDFHRAIIYVDLERQWPIGYEGFDWPQEAGGEPVLIERYFYSEIQANLGLTDADFDPDNPAYKYPK